MPESVNLLAYVIDEYGARCCDCFKNRLAGHLIAAPNPVYATDRENVLAPVDELRPWCGPCWKKARKRATEDAAERQRVELEEAQGALFDTA